MSLDIPESDWRRFKEVHAKLLERYCSRVLEEVAATCQDTKGSAHERYLKVFKLIDERDKEIARLFNDYRRSTALMQLAIMRKTKLLTDEDLLIGLWD